MVYSDEEILRIAQLDPSLLVPNTKKILSKVDNIDDDLKWIVDGHLVEKTTPVSVIVQQRKKKE